MTMRHDGREYQAHHGKALGFDKVQPRDRLGRDYFAWHNEYRFKTWNEAMTETDKATARTDTDACAHGCGARTGARGTRRCT